MTDGSDPKNPRSRPYDRTLGVVECFKVIDEQCPSGAVRAVAQRALETAKKGEPEWMLEWRLKAYRHWLTMEMPSWLALVW